MLLEPSEPQPSLDEEPEDEDAPQSPESDEPDALVEPDDDDESDPQPSLLDEADDVEEDEPQSPSLDLVDDDVLPESQSASVEDDEEDDEAVALEPESLPQSSFADAVVADDEDEAPQSSPDPVPQSLPLLLLLVEPQSLPLLLLAAAAPFATESESRFAPAMSRVASQPSKRITASACGHSARTCTHCPSPLLARTSTSRPAGSLTLDFASKEGFARRSAMRARTRASADAAAGMRRRTRVVKDTRRRFMSSRKARLVPFERHEESRTWRAA